MRNREKIMTKQQLLTTLHDELSQRPSPELLDCQQAAQRVKARAFHQFWQALNPDETVRWPELTVRLNALARHN